ncbi:MAG: type II secretion system F family protein [Betaproteobacteria bacterium]|nr:type II secretion system F family protein [Betaproteobacteria bacterium]MBV9361086.1 type II secretion system F family protein [Betaproteobacteria bacterium]
MQFNVHAIDAQQQVIALRLEAAGEADARGQAEQRGLTVFSIESRRSMPRLHRAGGFKTSLFSIELLSLLEAGLNLVEALQTLAEKDTTGERQQVVSGLVASISRGEPFSKAVAAFPEHFSPLYVATIKASERTGNVKEALSRFIAYHDELDKVKKKVVSASIYPAILMIVGTLVLGFLMFYVVPRFAGVYEDMHNTLPLFSRLLLSFGSFIGRHSYFLFSAFILGVGSFAWALSRPNVRSAVMQRIWQLPALGERMKTYQLARLYRTAGMLMRAGIPAVRALEMVQDLLASHLRPQLVRARSLIGEGHAMSAALGAAGLATPVAARMLTVGERSGDMGRMLGEIARFHDDEVARFIDWFTRAFEPVLMAVLGVAIGLVVVLMYMPIFELAGNIK